MKVVPLGSQNNLEFTTFLPFSQHSHTTRRAFPFYKTEHRPMTVSCIARSRVGGINGFIRIVATPSLVMV
jgi:hypothetical protein